MECDDVDKKILDAVLDNAKMSLRDIAKQVKVSVATAMNRVRRMEKEGIIKKYTTVVDYGKLGFDVEVIIEVRVSKGRLIDVEKKIASEPNVFAVYDVTGDYDAIILARFKNRRAMDQFLKKIQRYDFVERTHTLFVLNTIKEDFVKVG